MRIVIDLQGAQCGSRHRGIGRYSLALAKAMIKHGRNHEFIVALSGLFPETIEPIRAAFQELLPQESIRVWTAAGNTNAMDASNTWRRNAAELIREAFLQSLNPDIVHVTSMVEGFDDNAVHSVGLLPRSHGVAVTFYDAIPLIQSDVYLRSQPDFELLYREKIDHIRRSDILLAISESSRQEAIKYLGMAENQVVDIAAAADDGFRPLQMQASSKANLLHRFGLTRPFVMYSGATDERKNHLRLISAFARLPAIVRKTHQLAIVGRLPEHHRLAFVAHIRASGLAASEVIITGNVTDLELQQLYNLCRLFVFPSWHEGFGLPALEAMACGAPVIGSNTTSLPEVIGRDDALFDPFDVASISEKMKEVLGDDDFRKELARHGLVQASKFSWKKSAAIGLDMFERWHENRVHENRVNALPVFLGKREPSAESVLTDEIVALSAGQPSTQDWICTAQAIAQNHPRQAGKQLFVDVSELAVRDSRSGVQRVVRSVLAQLLKDPPAGFRVRPVLATHETPGYRYANKFDRAFQDLPAKSYADDPIEPQSGDIFLGLDLQQNIVFPQKPFLSSLRNLGVQLYFVVYDLLPIITPWAFPKEWDMSNTHSMWLHVISQHDGVICISRSVADEFKQWLDAFGMHRLRPLKVGWFHLGADVQRSMPTLGMPTNAVDILKTLQKRPSFLSVGTIEPRKAQAQMLRAFEQLWKDGEDLNLVLVGRKGWDVDLLVEELRTHPEADIRLFWLEGASDEYLDALYDTCDCLIVGSVAEGFGLPLVEAAMHGIPIITRDIPVFREVAGENALFFHGESAAALADKVLEWVALDRDGRAPSSKKIAWQTWQQSTAALLDVFMGGRWYYQWESHPGERISASSGRFGTHVGERHILEMRSTQGTAGALMHGPRISLEAGEYTVVVRGRALEVPLIGARTDVVLEHGDIVLAEADLVEPVLGLEAELARMSISVPEKCDNLEVRVWVEAATRVAISLVDITPAALLPQGAEITSN